MSKWTNEYRMECVKRILDRFYAGETPEPAYRSDGETEAQARFREAWDHVGMLVALPDDVLDASGDSLAEMIGDESEPVWEIPEQEAGEK